MTYPVLQRRFVKASQFILFWEKLYDFGNEETYTAIMAKPTWETEDITNLFLWKNNMGKDKENLAVFKQAFVDKLNNRISKINELRQNFTLKEYLNTFGDLPTVWGTTLLHAISKAEYPIYDQHVHRAFAFLSDGHLSKIPVHNPTKYKVYLGGYVPFFNNLKVEARIEQPKRVDNALWAFGRFLSLYPKVSHALVHPDS